MEIQHRIQLVDLMKELNLPLIAAEAGVAEARFSRELLSAGLDKLYMIDAWSQLSTASGDGRNDQSWHDKNYYEAIERVKEFGDKSVFLRGLSTDMAQHIPDNSLGMVYIDCDHSYENVLKDLQAYFPKVVEGGIVAGHDIGNPSYGVEKAVKEFCEKKFEIHIIPEDEQLNSSFLFLKKTNKLI